MRRNRREFLKLTMASGAAFLTGSTVAGAKKKRPNIILVMADDISAKEFPTYNIPNPMYGDEPCTTPVFERIKNEGVQFRHGWATPLCHPSRGMMMTGRYAHRTQWWSNEFGPIEGEDGYPLYKYHLTLGQIAKKANYSTQFVGKWQLGGTMEGYGFDEYVMTPGSYAARSPAELKGNNGVGKASFYWNSGYSLTGHPNHPLDDKGKSPNFKTTWNDFAADIELKYMKDYMRRKGNQKEPFFIYWPAHLGHSNWDYVNNKMGYPGVPPMDEKRYPKTKHIKVKMPDGTMVHRTEAGMNYHVQYLDYCIGELIAESEKLGIDKDTIFLISTDNATTEYGKGLKGAVKEHGPKVPFFVYGPGYFKGKGEVDDFASLVDFAPTIAKLTGAKLPDKYEFNGLNLMPFLTGKKKLHRDWAYSYNAEYQMVRTRNVVRDGMGFFWDARGTLDQESYMLIDEENVDPTLKKEVKQIKAILAKYPTAPTSGKMYERYMKEKAGKWELWDKMRERILKENGK